MKNSTDKNRRGLKWVKWLERGQNILVFAVLFVLIILAVVYFALRGLMGLF